MVLLISHLAFARRIKGNEQDKNVSTVVSGRNIAVEKWELRWARSQTAAIYPKRNYVVWLKNIYGIVNPDGENKTIFYPGIGPYIGFDEIDLVSPLLGTGYTNLVGIDKQHLSFDKFVETVRAALRVVEEAEIEEFKDFGSEKYQVKFMFQGKKRTVTVYYGVDGNYFFPEELEDRYDGIYSRWMTTVFDPTMDMQAQDTRAKWLKFLNPETGFLITDSEYPYFDRQSNGFWSNFTEIPLQNVIYTAVIANARRAHLLVLKGQKDNENN